MASYLMPFSAAFSSPLRHFTQNKTCPAAWASSMAASWTPTNSIKSSIGSAKPGFLQHGLFSQSSNLPGFFVKRRSFGVHATAATEKSLYDFTVKVIYFAPCGLKNFNPLIAIICFFA